MTQRSSRPDGENPRATRIAELRKKGAAGVRELVEELVQPNFGVRREVVRALSEAAPDAMPALVASLRDTRDNEAKISGVVDALAASKNDIDESLLDLLNDNDVAVLCDAAQILGRRQSVPATRALTELTQHSDDNVALSAVEALGRIGGRAALDALLIVSKSGNFFRVFPAIDALGRLGDSRALSTLVELSREPLYAAEAVRALGRLGDVAALPSLLEQLLRAPDNLVGPLVVSLAAIREAAQKRFGTGKAVEEALVDGKNVAEVRRRLTAALKRADSSEQVALGQALSWIGEESTVPTLLELLRSTPAVSKVAAASLRRLGASAEPQLREALRVGNSELRRLVIPIVSGRSATRDELLECLSDDDALVRAQSCDALARVSDVSAVGALFPLLGDTDARVAQAALSAIQSLGSDETRRLALAAARSDDVRMRRAAFSIIGYFGYPEGLDVLAEAAESSDERLRDAAIAGLPFIDEPRAAELLVAAAGHASPRTRASAMRALGHGAGDPPALSAMHAGLLDPDPWVRYYACQALGKLHDDSATESIASLLNDGSGQVRVAAVEALAHLRGNRAFEVLCSVLGSEDADLERAALVALGISKRQEALLPLQRALAATDPATRLVALSALSESGFAEVLPNIAAATRDADPGVQIAAVGFLAARVDRAATDELIGLLAQRPDDETLIQALSRPAPWRVQAMAAALEAADDARASALVASLSRTQSEEAVEALRHAFTSRNEAARRAAAGALVAIDDLPSKAALAQAALGDPDAEVRRICAASFGR